MRQFWRTMLTSLLFLLPVIARAEWVEVSGTAMTTPVELEFWADRPEQVETLGDRVLAEFQRLDEQMSRYREQSELSRLNRRAGEGPVEVSPGLFRVLARARDISDMSNGAFDISFGSVGFLYDYRKRRQPSAEDLAATLGAVDYRDIVLDGEMSTVHFRKQGLRVDLGGIAKGYAVDRGIDILRQAGIQHARLSAGGDLRLLGDRRGKPWIVGVRDPRSEDRNAVVLPLSDVAVSTSGDYERFFIDDSGKRVHHILSPRSGRPAEGVQSVTVIGEDALTTDGLSTAVFVLGVEKGIGMINRLPGIDAIVIDEQRKMHYSEGLGAPGSD